MAYTPLANIPIIAQLYASGDLQPSDTPYDNATSKYNTTISLIRTDITKLSIDAIVNAANTSLLGGGGVDGAIHNAAGPQLVEECATLNGCDTGSAKITGAYRLPCQRVIHAVGPVYSIAKRAGAHETLLQGCYTASLDLCASEGLKSVAFAALSTGVYGYPSEEAAEAAIRAVKGWLEADEERAARLDRVIFCQFMEKDQRAYEKFIPRFFPPGADELPKGEDTTTAEEAGAEPSASDDKAEDGDKTPDLDLPDAPKDEPTMEGQSQPKKAKLDDESEKKE